MNDTDKCRLCLNEQPLLKSHIIPSFVFKWAKETGGTDFFRSGKSPNRRVQDGLKSRLLCAKCENRFSRWEKWFSENVFVPSTVTNYPAGRYGIEYSRFAASLVWRAGQHFLEHGTDIEISPEDKRDLQSAVGTWRSFILGEKDHPERFELHVVPVADLRKIQDLRAPDNWNRYCLRHIEMDLAYAESGGFLSVVVKLGPVSIVGHVRNNLQKWKGSRIATREGFFNPKKIVWPPTLLDYFFWRARNNQQIVASLSSKQVDLTKQSILKNLDRVAESGMFKAMLEDADRFGLDAVIQKEDP
ncbi:MAG: hypothetical protein ACMUJK_01770 [Rhodobacterales bacterium]